MGNGKLYMYVEFIDPHCIYMYIYMDVEYTYFSSFILFISTYYSDLWSTEQNSLVKRKVSSRVCSCNWTSDGQFFALGLFNGSVTIWTKVSFQYCACACMCACRIMCLQYIHVHYKTSTYLLLVCVY